MRRIPRPLGVAAAALAAALLLSACADDAATRPDETGVVVRGQGGAVRITNLLADPVYYFGVEREDAAALNWTPCTLHREVCPHVDAGETVAIPYAELPGHDPGDDEGILFWWHLVSGSEGLRPDEVRSIVFRLR